MATAQLPDDPRPASADRGPGYEFAPADYEPAHLRLIERAATLASVATVRVNPAYTSLTCFVCGERGQRETQALFACPQCGSHTHADVQAALAAMLDAAAGHPYMLQAVGEAVWGAAADPASGITDDEATVGIAQARCAMGPDIYAPTWPHLSAVHRDLLAAALSSDDTPIATLASAAGRPHLETAEHCAALARRGFFQTPQAGSVRFAHPEARRFVEAQGLWQGRDAAPRQRLPDVEQTGPHLT